MEQVSVNSTLLKSAILEFRFWVRLIDLRTQDLTQIQYKLRQIAYVDTVCRSVRKPYGHGSPLTAQTVVIGPTDTWNYTIDCYIHCRIIGYRSTDRNASKLA